MFAKMSASVSPSAAAPPDGSGDPGDERSHRPDVSAQASLDDHKPRPLSGTTTTTTCRPAAARPNLKPDGLPLAVTRAKLTQYPH